MFSLNSRHMRLLLLVCFFAIAPGAWAQGREVSCLPEDRETFKRTMGVLETLSSKSMGETVVAVGEQFLGTPYVANTLETQGPEQLVVNFRGLDCTTFVENVLAMSRAGYREKANWDSFVQELERLRYRDGRLSDYASRLHYFTEWIRDNERKGVIKDITQEIGGKAVRKDIDFMGTHPELYPALGRKDQLQAVRSIESTLSSSPVFVLPREEVADRESMLRDGDIIALATSIPGLDVTHTGIAITGDDGRIHLLHASTTGSVVVSREPLAEYLKKIKRNTGIIAVRPLIPEP